MTPSSITATDIANCGGMPPDRRRLWADRGQLRGEAPFREHDAIETAVAVALTEKTTQQKATTAFEAIRTDLRSYVLSGKASLWALIPERGEDFQLLKSAASAADAAAALSGPVWLVPLTDVIEQARIKYARRIERLSGVGSDVRQLPSAGAPKP
jgi:hypothetical protein